MDRPAATADHRHPPRPPHETAPDGLCRMCGTFAGRGVSGRQRNWHPNCLSLWLVCADPRAARAFVFKRDGGTCAMCGVTDPRIDGEWDVDHRLRLRDVPRELAYWLPSNLQSLCRAVCHRLKTAAENRVT